MELKSKIAQELKKIETLLVLLRQRRKHTLSEHEVEQTLKEVSERLFVLCEDAVEIVEASPRKLALRRAIPLALTILVSLCTSAILSHYNHIIAKCSAIFAFAPLVSAVCGNYGLQTAAITIRAIAVRTLGEGVMAFLKELATALLTGAIVGALGGFFAFLITGDIKAFAVVHLAMMSGIVTSAVMGYVIPLVMHAIGVDPAMVAGPGETTFQDIVSYSVYLLCLKLFFRV